MRLAQKKLYKGMLVKLKKEQFFDFIDTSNVGVVISWYKKEVDIVFSSGARERHWIWNLEPLNKEDEE